MASEIVNVLVAFACIYLFAKWMSKGNGNGNGHADTPAAILGFTPRKVTDDMIATVHGAFPDIPRANIHYDLLKTGSAEVTSNKILERGVLDAPPQSYYRAFPQQPEATPAHAANPVLSTTSEHPRDLISRFNLEQRVTEAPAASDAPSVKISTWEQSSDKREAILRERKAQMILEARRRMAEKLKGSGTS